MPRLVGPAIFSLSLLFPPSLSRRLINNTALATLAFLWFLWSWHALAWSRLPLAPWAWRRVQPRPPRSPTIVFVDATVYILCFIWGLHRLGQRSPAFTSQIKAFITMFSLYQTLWFNIISPQDTGAGQNNRNINNLHFSVLQSYNLASFRWCARMCFVIIVCCRAFEIFSAAFHCYATRLHSDITLLLLLRGGLFKLSTQYHGSLSTNGEVGSIGFVLVFSWHSAPVLKGNLQVCVHQD